MASLFVLKSGGLDKVADFIQIRNKEFMIMEYISVKSIAKAAKKLELNEKQFSDFVEKIPYNMITEFISDVD